MPDKNGKLSEDEIREIDEWTAKRIPEGARCPLCKKQDWQPGDYLTTPIVTNHKAEKLFGPDFPSFSIVCRNCGFIANLSARILGVV